MAEPAPLICRDIHKTFNKLEVLKGISLETRKGDVVSLIGSSGPARVPFCAASICWKPPPPVTLLCTATQSGSPKTEKVNGYPPITARWN